MLIPGGDFISGVNLLCNVGFPEVGNGLLRAKGKIMSVAKKFGEICGSWSKKKVNFTTANYYPKEGESYHQEKTHPHETVLLIHPRA